MNIYFILQQKNQKCQALNRWFRLEQRSILKTKYQLKTFFRSIFGIISDLKDKEREETRDPSQPPSMADLIRKVVKKEKKSKYKLLFRLKYDFFMKTIFR